MNICGYEFEDGGLCCQVPGHERDDVPHLHMGEGGDYWDERRARERKEEFKTRIRSINFGKVM